MRLDKFLKISRLIKRRTLAKDVADQGRITVNGNQAKAATNIKVGDVLVIQFGQKVLTLEVQSLRENVKKDEAATLYKIVKEEAVQQS
ncbi:RNA-binding S4 domain-containing protein [Thalassobacillus pellis]|uniref:RNA-binding S4 domain-containing protein n=1 Tax=Thalassobacillus pellis TaxID=748008 RepID=UPI00195FF5E2|nr:RNA-binding S4 domain-containing protein [Thalassobacillus pellis]MBM7555135.1 ribosomal 50S subunit-recycling heat shock protein [Thalassobacillus pellis]